MTTQSIVLIVVYIVIAALSALAPVVEVRAPRLAGIMQILAAIGLDVLRLRDGARKLAVRNVVSTPTPVQVVAAAPANPAELVAAPAPEHPTAQQKAFNKSSGS